MSDKKEIKPYYASWVPRKKIIVLWVMTVLILALAIDGFIMHWHWAINTGFLIVGLIVLYAAITFSVLKWVLSFRGGRLMPKVHDYVISKLGWNGEGKMMDVGCGSGALCIKLAKMYPNAKIHGLDHWGFEWDYGQKMCEENARLEKVKNTYFMQGDARKIKYPDETFDAVVSNLVYHEVKFEKDKKALMRETLRVLKKGGYFVLHDLFEDQVLYGNIEDFVKELKKEGYEEVHYEPHTENLPFVPDFVRHFLYFRKMGILYGRK